MAEKIPRDVTVLLGLTGWGMCYIYICTIYAPACYRNNDLVISRSGEGLLDTKPRPQTEITLFPIALELRVRANFQIRFIWRHRSGSPLAQVYTSKPRWLRYQLETVSALPVTCPLWDKPTDHRWISLTSTGNAGFDVFFDVGLNKWLKKKVEWPVIWDIGMLIVTSL